MKGRQCNQCLWQGTTTHTCRNVKSPNYEHMVMNYVWSCGYYSSAVMGSFKSEKIRGIRQVRKL